MAARFMQTPIGPIAIRPDVIDIQSRLSDRQVADKALARPFGDPEAFAELVHRGLCRPGMMDADIYKLIEQREAEAHAPCHLN